MSYQIKCMTCWPSNRCLGLNFCQDLHWFRSRLQKLSHFFHHFRATNPWSKYHVQLPIKRLWQLIFIAGNLNPYFSFYIFIFDKKKICFPVQCKSSHYTKCCTLAIFALQSITRTAYIIFTLFNQVYSCNIKYLELSKNTMSMCVFTGYVWVVQCH